MSDKKTTYEGMFLLDAGNPDFNAAGEPVRAVLARSEAEILALNPWEDRKLAFEIKGRKRGLYVLTYFKVDPLKVAEIEHDCLLDERILRSMILRRDHITDEQINAKTPATEAPPKELELPAVEPTTAKIAEIQEIPEIAADEDEDNLLSQESEKE